MKAGFAWARSSAVLMPRTLSLRAIRFPTPQISSTGCSESSFRVRCGFPRVRASTPRNCFHSLEAHWADLARVFVGPAPTSMVRRVQSYTCWRSCRPGPCSAPHRSSQGTSRRSNTVPPWGPAPPGSSSRAPTSRHLCGIENQYK